MAVSLHSLKSTDRKWWDCTTAAAACTEYYQMQLNIL